MARKPKAARLDFAALSKAQAAHEAAGHPSYNGPLYQAVAREALEECHKAFEAGDVSALVSALDQCAMRELVMPDWLAREWLRRSRSVRRYNAASWDEVLPVAKPKGRKLAALRLGLRWTLPVVQAVCAEVQAGKPLDAGLFEVLAKRNRWPFSGAQAKKLYYAARKKPDSGTGIYFDRLTAARRRTQATSTIRRKP